MLTSHSRQATNKYKIMKLQSTLPHIRLGAGIMYQNNAEVKYEILTRLIFTLAAFLSKASLSKTNKFDEE